MLAVASRSWPSATWIDSRTERGSGHPSSASKVASKAGLTGGLSVSRSSGNEPARVLRSRWNVWVKGG